MNRALLLLSILLLAAWTPILSSCAGDTEEERLHITGTVVFVPLEGGFFGIVGEDGQKYDPVNLRAEFKDFEEDGLPVEVKAVVLRGMAGIHQWGRLISIEEISRR